MGEYGVNRARDVKERRVQFAPLLHRRFPCHSSRSSEYQANRRLRRVLGRKENRFLSVCGRRICQRARIFLLKKIHIIVAPGLLLACSSVIGAESEQGFPSEEMFLSEVPVVLTVTRLAQPKTETPAAVTVIDRDMISASGVRKIADLFRLVPGFQVGYNHGFRPVVTYHGLADEYARRMQVLVDGRSVYDVLVGGVFWADLPLAIEDIDRIEVIRGPNAAAYGSNSFLAVINIITLHASQEQGTSLKLAAGEHHIRDGFVRHGWETAGGNARLSLAYSQDDNLDNLPDSEYVPLATFRGDFRTSPVDTFELQLGINGDSHTVGHDGSQTGPPRDANITSYFQQLRWRRALDENEEISIQFYHNYWKKNEDYLTAPLDLSALGLGVVPVPISSDGAADRYDLEFQHILNPFNDWRFVWGAGARLDQARARAYFGTDDTVENRIYRLFGNAEWRARPDTVVNAGAMLEKDDLGGTNLSPRLALNHHLSPHDTVRFSASTATHTPVFIEEKGNARFFYNGVLLESDIESRGGLKAETMRSYEIGYLGQIPDPNLSIDLRIYQDRIHNQISELNVPSADPMNGRTLDYRNEGQVEVRGTDIQLDYRPTRDTRFILSYANMKAFADGLSADANFTAEEHQRSVPAFSGSLLVMHRFSSLWQGSLAYYRTDDIDWLGSGDYNKGHGRLDVRIARNFRLDGARGEAAFVIQNAGPKYMEFDDEGRFDRRAFVTLSLKP